MLSCFGKLHGRVSEGGEDGAATKEEKSIITENVNKGNEAKLADN